MLNLINNENIKTKLHNITNLKLKKRYAIIMHNVYILFIMVVLNSKLTKAFPCYTYTL